MTPGISVEASAVFTRGWLDKYRSSEWAAVQRSVAEKLAGGVDIENSPETDIKLQDRIERLFSDKTAWLYAWSVGVSFVAHPAKIVYRAYLRSALPPLEDVMSALSAKRYWTIWSNIDESIPLNRQLYTMTFRARYKELMRDMARLLIRYQGYRFVIRAMAFRAAHANSHVIAVAALDLDNALQWERHNPWVNPPHQAVIVRKRLRSDYPSRIEWLLRALRSEVQCGEPQKAYC